jgi:hypothetical protein
MLRSSHRNDLACRWVNARLPSVGGEDVSDQPVPDQPAPDQPAPDDSKRIVQWVIGGCIAVLVVAAIWAFLLIEICDQQVTNNGNVVEVCRHMGTSDPPAVAVGLILLLLLSFFFTEISGFGITLKREVREAKQVAQRAQATALQNKEDIGETDSDLKEVSRRILAPQEPTEAEQASPETAAEDPTIAELARKYNHIRLTMTRGPARTREMTSVVNRMRSYLQDVERFDLNKHLNSSDRGLRLAAYAYLHVRPDPVWAATLVSTLIDREDKPFGEYWALQALKRQCEVSPAALDRDTKRRLEEFLKELPPGTDRDVELRSVLRTCSA